MSDLLYTGSEALLTSILPMTATQVRALLDGRFFLQHGATVLAPLAIESYCRQCHVVGEPPEIRIEALPDRWKWACCHSQGFARIDRPLPELAELLHYFGWGLRCTRCYADLDAANTPTDQVLTVTCPCTIRRMVNPLAATVDARPIPGLDGPAPLR